jgi:hypothetical protein
VGGAAALLLLLLLLPPLLLLLQAQAQAGVGVRLAALLKGGRGAGGAP